MEEKTILIIEDNEEIREIIRILLENEGYHVLEAENGEQGLFLLSNDISLIILDVMMPGKNGYRICQEIRKTSLVPVLFLTAKQQDSDKTMGFSAGGDDYLTKPFSNSELIARVKALIRRYYIYRGKDTTSIDEYIQIDNLKINTSYNEIFKNNKEIELTDLEYHLLLLLAKNPKKIFSISNLYESVWEEPYFYICNSTVMVHIRKLRVKLEDDPQHPKHIINIWGKGYRLE